MLLEMLSENNRMKKSNKNRFVCFHFFLQSLRLVWGQSASPPSSQSDKRTDFWMNCFSSNNKSHARCFRLSNAIQCWQKVIFKSVICCILPWNNYSSFCQAFFIYKSARLRKLDHENKTTDRRTNRQKNNDVIAHIT